MVGFFLFFFKLMIFPGTVVEGSDGGVARVEDDVVVIGIEVRAREIAAGGLQGVEKKAGGFVLDLMRQKQAHDLHERDLDGVGVFEDREGECGLAATSVGFGIIGGEADALILKALVEETETAAAERGRSALDSVDFDVLAALGISGHCGSFFRDFCAPSPLPGGSLESSGWGEIAF
jgi:hypothetical protein